MIFHTGSFLFPSLYLLCTYCRFLLRFHHKTYIKHSQVALVKNPSANAREAGDTGSIPQSERSLGVGMAAYSSVLTWKAAWTENLVSYSPWGHKDWVTEHIVIIVYFTLITTELQLHTKILPFYLTTHTFCFGCHNLPFSILYIHWHIVATSYFYNFVH